jgi:hypothetical protein
MNRVLADAIDAHRELERRKRFVTVETHVGRGGELQAAPAFARGNFDRTAASAPTSARPHPTPPEMLIASTLLQTPP